MKMTLPELHAKFFKDYPFLDSSFDPFSSLYVHWLEKQVIELSEGLQNAEKVPRSS